MGCQCKTSETSGNTTADRERVLATLEQFDLREVFEQAAAIPDTAAGAIRHLQKSERADRLGLGADVVALYRRAAVRENAQSIRQLRAVIARLDERVSRADWPDLVQRTSREFADRDGPAFIADAREHMGLAMFEADGLSADDAETSVTIVNRVFDRVLADGLDGVTGMLREQLDHAAEAFATPEMGRQPASPMSERQMLCIFLETLLCGAALVGCMFIPFCWCCLGIAILILCAIAIATCLLVVP